MRHMSITEEQGFRSIKGFQASTSISKEIERAIQMSEKSGANMTVVKTSSGLEVFTDYQMQVAKEIISQAIYTANGGFILHLVAQRG